MLSPSTQTWKVAPDVLSSSVNRAWGVSKDDPELSIIPNMSSLKFEKDDAMGRVVAVADELAFDISL